MLMLHAAAMQCLSQPASLQFVRVISCSGCQVSIRAILTVALSVHDVVIGKIFVLKAGAV